MGRIHNIEGKKNKMDSQRSASFTKHARNISVAARMGGGDPAYNATLKLAIDKAKADNMPNDNIQRAIKKGTGDNDSDKFEHITYEGYGPGGVAIMIDCLTDNKNRTAGNVRHLLDKNGGNLGTNGCVAFLFERKGAIAIDRAETPIGEDELMELVLENGAEDFISEADYFEVITGPEDFSPVLDACREAGASIITSDISMLPVTTVEADKSTSSKMEKLLNDLEADDDVQNVYTNAQ
ncbi:MAG: YebC/PmpR family DNA-binding transcriptional regulator [Clostridiales bacterium]|uniref:Probable transcriptional regulatory protein SAMN04489866_101170 n=1 Tax=Peptococcus niger TaxID=2741 RepID=A0A1G6S132_PEPNI|nr:YebC/PmpR family DNA-binding transcriptional regulator [Peptococcus niger]MDU5951929.1 YebC/PmpR family DNA-binding transcriptional regulator [Clostridiales bacterium]SDD09886.1 DNA-binding regulatory protein, YebC/PmpR family [Peptococcus niger]